MLPEGCGGEPLPRDRGGFPVPPDRLDSSLPTFFSDLSPICHFRCSMMAPMIGRKPMRRAAGRPGEGRSGKAPLSFSNFPLLPLHRELTSTSIRYPAALRLPTGTSPAPCPLRPGSEETYVRAARLSRTGRKRGVTIRSLIDCLIAAIAMEQEATVLHRDRDFDRISGYAPLKTI